MQNDIQLLKELPLKELISAPLNAVIEAQADAAMTTVAFIESIGMVAESGAKSFLDDDGSATQNHDYQIRMAHFSINKMVNGTQVATSVEMPYISFFNPSSLEINSMELDFNVRLKSIESFSAGLGVSTSVNGSTTTEGQLNWKKRAKVSSTLKVETAMKSDFEMRFKSDREQEYNLHIKVNANSAPLPKGISKLLDIVEAVATAPTTP